ncbi:9812_t:CDS:2 [Cetraspora pellucida]|uniref:9812_t:CDS:1 n=1 Tax=Cetraspora pellucida TaxID=1433469 RepID=A0A9N9C2P8_9GLOM|nr:9812_t:CDS:2 [Cetraspora pellucida]
MYLSSWWSFPYSKSNLSKQSINFEDNIHPVVEVSEAISNSHRIMSTYGISPKSDSTIISETASDISGVSTFTDSTSTAIISQDLNTVHLESEKKSENVDKVTSSNTINSKVSAVDNSSNLSEQIIKPDINNLKNPTTNDVSPISKERKFSSLERSKKSSSSEPKRRSLLGTWFSSSTDMSENISENDFIKASDVTSSTKALSKSPTLSDLTTSTVHNIPSSTSNTSTPLNNDLSSSQGSTTSQKLDSSINKLSSIQHSTVDDPPNPLVQTLPKNSSPWIYLFATNRSGVPKISQNLDTKLITNSEIDSQSRSSEMTTKVSISTDVDKKSRVSTDVDKKSKVITSTDVDKKLKVITSTDVDKKSKVVTSTDVDKKSKVVTSTDVDKKSKVTTSNDVDKKVSMSPSVSPKLKPSMVKLAPVSIVLPKFDEFVINKPVKHPDAPVQKALHAINSYLFPPDKPIDGSLPKWLDEITRSTIDVKRIAIIGVHGWFPAKLLRVVVGEPTGTSPKFCDMMAKAVLGYLSQHNISLPSDAITCIPLEGEGTIETREQLLHKNLLYNKTWCEALTLADVVFVATHSQGTPVGTILLSRLIKERLVNPKQQRICLLAMAGISHGPFPYLKDHYIIKYFVGAGRSPDVDASRELFEFMDSESAVAKKYRDALNIVTQKGVKLVYVASMDDQVVPLYSGIFIGVDHPSIMRAIYVDGPLYQENDFLINLIIFAIKLRNAGILDNGLITQLSEVIIGSLYGEGHSTLYNEIDVYTLAVRYLFEVPSLGTSEVKLSKFQAQPKYNPYFLPWSVRGILEDKNVTGNPRFINEVNRLKKLYEDWDPSSKALKELKFRLEPFRDTILGKWKL